MLDELLLVLIVAGPLLLLGGTIVLAFRRWGRSMDERTTAALFVALGFAQVVLAVVRLALDGWTWQPILPALVGLFFIAVYLPRLRTSHKSTKRPDA